MSTAAPTSFYEKELARLVEENGEIYRYLLAVGVSIAALLEVVDTSITNVALPHIQGNLGATTSEAAWVVTSYAVANVITMPLAVWLGHMFGRKRYFIFSMLGFTAASVVCGLAPNLMTLVLARVMQGLFGGGLIAKAQALLFESFPREKQGMVQAMFGMCVIVGPIIGPTLGGWLTDNFDWRWIFFINLPIGLLATALCQMFIPRDEEQKLSFKDMKVDWLGILSLSVMLGGLQYVCEKGQDDDWFSSPIILATSIAAAIAFGMFLIQELTTDKPAVDLRVLRHRSVAVGVMYSTLLGFVLFGTNYIIPNFSQTMLGYTAFQAGILQVPSSLVMALMFPIVGSLAGKIDSRWMVAAGTIMLSISAFWLSTLTLDAGWDQFLYPSLLRGAATVMMYMPLTLATVGGLPTKDIGGASAFMSLSRSLGGSVGIATLTTMLIRRTDFHRAMMSEHMTTSSPAFNEHVNALTGMWNNAGFTIAEAHQRAMGVISGMMYKQALVVSFNDLTWLLAVSLLVTLPFVFALSSGKKAAVPADAH